MPRDQRNKDMLVEYLTGRAGHMFFAAFVLIGMGLGLIFSNTVTGALIGVGFAFLVLATIRSAPRGNSRSLGARFMENRNHGFLAGIGIIFILSGFIRATGLSLYSDFMVGALFLAIGFVMALQAVRVLSRHRG